MSRRSTFWRLSRQRVASPVNLSIDSSSHNALLSLFLGSTQWFCAACFNCRLTTRYAARASPFICAQTRVFLGSRSHIQWTTSIACVFNRSFIPDILSCKRCALCHLPAMRVYPLTNRPPLPQVQELRAAGCVGVVEEQTSGGSRSWPVLAPV